MNKKPLNHREEGSVKAKLKQQTDALLISKRYLIKVKHSLY